MEFIPIANTYVGQEEADAVYNVVQSGWISMGKKVEEFERMFCEYTGTKHAVAFSNGSISLQSILAALDVGPGDEVIVPSLTYISSANAVLFQNAELVLCESDPLTFNVTVEDIEQKITSRTKVIMAVDLKGMPVDYDALIQLAKKRGVYLIADSAESLGAVYKGKRIGNQAPVHSFSFFANKNITTGEGGMVTTNDDRMAELLRIYRNQGQEGRYNHTKLGFNARLTDMAAAFGIEQFKRIDWLIQEKEKIARYYYNNLKHELIRLPVLPDFVDQHSWYMFSISLDKSINRDKFIAKLKDHNIDTRLSFPPVHIQDYYINRFGYKPEDYPKAYEAFCQFVDIPCWIGLREEQLEYICSRMVYSLEDCKQIVN